MSTVQLAWRLAWSGGRFRALAVVGGNAVVSLLFLLAVALPAAIRPPGRFTTDARLQALSVVVCLCLPIVVLAMSLGRLSASTRDRRLAALRLLGLSPGRTRCVAAAENAVLAGAGVLVGLLAAAATAPAVTNVLAGPGWLQRSLHLTPALAAASCLGLVLLALVVSLAPTRTLHRDSLTLRHEGTTRPPSRWRLVPLVAGTCCLVGTLLWTGTDPDLAGVLVLLGGAGMTGVGVVLALPLAVGAVADVLGRGGCSTTVRLAARRLQVEPGAAVRTAAGLTIAAFVITGALGVLTAFKSWPEYVGQHRALTRGPQLDQIFLPQGATPATAHKVRDRLESTPGVRGVLTDYGIGSSSDRCGPDDFCGEVFIGTCRQLALVQVVPGCRDDTISLISSPQSPQRRMTHPITLAGSGSRHAQVRATPTVLTTDEAATRAIHSGTTPYSLFLPARAPEVAGLVGTPTGYLVLTGPGTSVREAVQAVGDELGVDVALDDLEDYEAVQGYQLLVTTLAVVVLGIGLLAVALTTIDRATERRRHIAAQVALGVPVRVLRGSQLLQTLIPVWLGVVAAVGFAALAVAAYVRLLDFGDAVPVAAILLVCLTGLAAATLIASITLPGISRRLTPDLLRRE